MALVDTPSAQHAGMSDYFRMSRQHQQDIADVMWHLRQRYPGVGVYLVSASRGTVSDAYVG